MRAHRIHALFLIAIGAACSDRAGHGGAGSVGGSSGGGGGNDDALALQLPDGGGNNGGNNGGGSDGGGVPPVPAGCVNHSVAGERLPLDLYLMLDSSASMLQKAAGDTTKWDAVRAALGSFFTDAKSAGMGVGLQFFPKILAGAPNACTSEAECGGFGPCLGIRTCSGRGYIDVCATDAECGAGSTCIPFGYCAAAREFCSPLGSACAGGTDTCRGPVEGYCLGRDSCATSDYATPAVTIAALPAAASALTGALAARTPDGYTPTAAALAGAIEQVRTRARANPQRRAAVILATDGLPTTCAPKDIGQIAAIARQAARESPAVPTFVVGVFAPEEQGALANLNLLAEAGGTTRAHLVKTTEDVTRGFLAALDEVRATAVGCEIKMPASTAAGKVDYGNVNVRFTAGNGRETTIPYVGDGSRCDPRGGWYYDVNPATGTPTTILTCEATCQLLKSDRQGKVDILIGCRTITID